MNRRTFVISAGAATVTAIGTAALIGLTRKSGRSVSGGFVEDGSVSGHAIRDALRRPSPTRVERVPVVIVGGGMAGLSAAWWLRRHGYDRFKLLELAAATGGNSRGGFNEVSAYPWGAHYVPIPGPRAEYVRLLFAEMGVLADGEWSERDLCHEPRERTFVHGRWHDGQEEALTLSINDRDELTRFAEEIDVLRHNGQFTLPLALGVQADSRYDRMTATQWLSERGYRSKALHWLVDYSCRDDFGTNARDTSAWAAIHYFAAREVMSEKGPLTWPEGNTRIANHLLGAVRSSVITSAPVYRIENYGSALRVLAGNTAYDCEFVIWAAPTFLAARVVENGPAVAFDYAPWLVTNLTLDRVPYDAGAAKRRLGDAPTTAWDNVIADSSSLGYVVATHQSLKRVQERTVWTHYWPLSGNDVRAERKRLMSTDWKTCVEWVLSDLERAHPDIRDCVARVDTLRYGHAMPRPVPGFLAQREELWSPSQDARVLYANSDVSGLSLFEEAQYRGITAANRVLAQLAGH